MDEKSKFLESVRTLIHFQPQTEEGVLGSKLGILINRSLGHQIWRRLGYSSLKEVLADLERLETVRTGLTRSGVFTVWPGSKIANSIQELEEGNSTNLEISPRLRREVWEAFIAEADLGLRCMHIITGEIRVNLKSVPTPEPEWKSIEPIDRETQVKWGREFLDNSNLRGNSEALSALESDTWYVDFPNSIRVKIPRLLGQWNWIRTQRTIEYAKKWTEDEGISLPLLFESFPNHVSPKGAKDIGKGGQERDQVLNLLNEMSTEDLLELRIPVRCLLARDPSALPLSQDDLP